MTKNYKKSTKFLLKIISFYCNFNFFQKNFLFFTKSYNNEKSLYYNIVCFH